MRALVAAACALRASTPGAACRMLTWMCSGSPASLAAKRSDPSSRGGATPSFSPPRTRNRASSSSSSAASGAPAPASTTDAEAEALELYRGTLFSLLWAQAGLSRLAPLPRRLAFAGPLASTLLTWLLYGLMAFDYRFTAESSCRERKKASSSSSSSSSASAAPVGVADRVAAFSRAWPFYLAFGVVAASPSLVLPFWEGMAAVAAIYPLFVALAASGDAAPPPPPPPEDASSSAAAAAAARRGRFSLLSVVFSPAIVVTDVVVSVLTPLAWRTFARAARLLQQRERRR